MWLYAVIRAIHDLERRTSVEPDSFCPSLPLDALRFVIFSLRLDGCSPDRPVTRLLTVPCGNGPRDVVINAHVIDLPQAARVIALILEVLRQRGDIRHRGAQRAADLIDTGRCRIASG